MKTEIDHHHKWGFVLSEQELRRVAQAGQEHATKVGSITTPKITATLKDGSRIESESLDDVLSLENGGQKAVTRLELDWSDGNETPKVFIRVRFEDPQARSESWNSVFISVVGESRDAVFVAAADLDERVKKTRTLAWPFITSRPWILMALFLMASLVGFAASQYYSPALSAVAHLEREYAAGRVTNPTEAIILLERLKASPRISSFVLGFMLPAAVAFIITYGAIFAIPRIAQSYVFYWGDAITRYDKRRSVQRIF